MFPPESTTLNLLDNNQVQIRGPQEVLKNSLAVYEITCLLINETPCSLENLQTGLKWENDLSVQFQESCSTENDLCLEVLQAQQITSVTNQELFYEKEFDFQFPHFMNVYAFENSTPHQSFKATLKYDYESSQETSFLVNLLDSIQDSSAYELPEKPSFLTTRQIPQSSQNVQVLLNWTPPAENGGTTVLKYKITRCTLTTDNSCEDKKENWVAVLEYTDSVLVGKTYKYLISSINAVGESLEAKEEIIKTQEPLKPTQVKADLVLQENGFFPRITWEKNHKY